MAYHRFYAQDNTWWIMLRLNDEKVQSLQASARVAKVSEMKMSKMTKTVSNRTTARKRKRCDGVRESYIGVSRNGAAKWKAEVSYKKKRVYLGTFRTAEEAAIRYNERSLEIHGGTRAGNFEPLPLNYQPPVEVDDDDELYYLLCGDEDGDEDGALPSPQEREKDQRQQTSPVHAMPITVPEVIDELLNSSSEEDYSSGDSGGYESFSAADLELFLPHCA